MWTYRRGLNIASVYSVTNIEVLRSAVRWREVENIIKERKLQFSGYVMRGDKFSIQRLVIQGKIQGKKAWKETHFLVKEPERIVWMQLRAALKSFRFER